MAKDGHGKKQSFDKEYLYRFKFNDKNAYPPSQGDGLEEVSSFSDGLSSQVKKINNRISEIEKRLDSFNERFQKQNDKLNSDKTRVIETLGIFVALFTFISSEIQIFKNESNTFRALGLSLVFAGILAFFVLILELTVRSNEELKDRTSWFRFCILLIMSVALITSGIAIASGHILPHSGVTLP
jgi:Mn2+/Fe2+ NRAMP family transporter